MIDTGELIPKATQQEVILQSLKPEMRPLVRQICPANMIPIKVSEDVTLELQRYANEDIYKIAFGIMSTASDKWQFNSAANILNTIARNEILSSVYSKSQTSIDFEGNRKKFLETVHLPKNFTLSDEAALLRRETLEKWNTCKQNNQPDHEIISKIADIFSVGDLAKPEAKFWYETYFSIVMDDQAPFELRNFLLKFANTTLNIRTTADKTSLWNRMDGSWFYTELFDKHEQAASPQSAGLLQRIKSLLPGHFKMKQQEVPLTYLNLATSTTSSTEPEKSSTQSQSSFVENNPQVEALKRQNDLLIKQLHTLEQNHASSEDFIRALKDQQSNNKQYIAQLEMQLDILEESLQEAQGDLKRTENLKQLLRMQHSLIEMYKECGGDPMDILNIPPNDWKAADAKGKKALLRKMYRSAVGPYHYDVPDDHPNFDPVKKELSNRMFNQLTLAYQYLEKQLDQNPDTQEQQKPPTSQSSPNAPSLSPGVK